MSSNGTQRRAAAHFKEHGYCSTAYNWGQEINDNQPVYSSFTANQDKLSHSAHFHLDQRAPALAQSREQSHFRSHSASEWARCSPSRKRPGTAERSVSVSKKCPSTVSIASESCRNSQRLSMPKSRISPLSSSSSNIPSASSNFASFGSPQYKSSKSDDRTSSGSKRSNFTKEQTATLNGWLKLNLEHPYPTEEEKFLLTEKAGITLNQVNNYYTNARRRSAYKKMCQEQGVVPVSRKKKIRSLTSNANQGEKENHIPIRGHSDSGLSSGGSRPGSVRSSSRSPASSPQLEASSPDMEASRDHAFTAYSGFISPSPLPSDVRPEVLAVSRKVVEPVYIDVPIEGYLKVLSSIAGKHLDADVKASERNLPRQHYITEELIAENPGLVTHVNNYYTNARHRSAYKKTCEEQGVVPVSKKKKVTSLTSTDNEDGEKENLIPVRGHPDSGLSSGGSRPASVQSSSHSPASSPQLEASSPDIEASQDHVFIADSGCNQVQSTPSQVPVFVHGSGIIPPPPLPSDVRPEVLAVSREVVEHVYIDFSPEDYLKVAWSLAVKHLDADVKAYERNLPRQHYIAEELKAEIPGLVIHVEKLSCDY